MPRGGKREGAGIPKGFRYPKTRARREAQAAYLKGEALTAVRVLEELRRLAFSDVGVLFDESGKLKPIHSMTKEERSAIAGLEVIVKNAEAGDGHTDTVHKVKVWDKVRALESLAKHFGLLTEKVEHSGGLEITWKSSE